ncbi:uncharacterized protein LOC135208171 [Macrobrachium nipponense]|uniref:uncharacterized protein LOC135208171 n=1 Tax=Macrobrachium nipponense TaxID=159736 RepID=UPI0030C81323
MATRLLSGTGRSLLEFTQQRYCAVLREDAPTFSDVITVVASHKEGASIRYSITGGNRDGLFTIDQKSGLITLAAALDYELHDKHELVVSGEGGGQVVRTTVEVFVADVNDNPPEFTHPDPYVTVIEEDDRHLPTTLLKVEATDPDQSDEFGLLYTLRGDGVDGYSSEDAFFKIYPRTGDLIQLRALDRDPPNGKRIWKLRVKAQDGQEAWKSGKRLKGTKNTFVKSRDYSSSWDYGNEFQNDQPIENTPGRRVDIATHTTQNDDVTKLNKNSGYKWDGSKIREDEIRRILSETKDNRYDRLVSLQSGGENARKRAWTREKNRKHKTKPFSWTNSNDRHHQHTQHSWKLKEKNNKDDKQLSWNDQYRFGILRSVYNYKNEENSHRNRWELSMRSKNEKRKDKRVSDGSTSRTAEGSKTKLENTSLGRVLQVQGMKDQISLSRLRSEELLLSSPDTSSASNKGQTFEISKELLTSSLNAYAAVKTKNTEPRNKKGKIKIWAINNGVPPQNYDSNRFFQKGDRICKGQVPKSDLNPDVEDTKEFRQKGYLSWRNSFKRRITFSEEAKLHNIASPTDDSLDDLISGGKFTNPHISQNPYFKSSDLEDIESSENVQLRKESRFVNKVKRSGGVFQTKCKINISDESSSSLETKGSIAAAPSTAVDMERLQEYRDQFKFNNPNSAKERKNKIIPDHSIKSTEATTWMLDSSSNNTKNTPTALFPQSKIDSRGKGVISSSGLQPTGVISNSTTLDKYAQNLTSKSSEAVSKKAKEITRLVDQQMEGLTLREYIDTLSQKTNKTLKNPNNKYSSFPVGQTLNQKLLFKSSGKRTDSVPRNKNLLPASVVRERRIRSYKLGNEKRESKWVLKKPRGKGWLSRGTRHIISESLFDRLDSNEEECYEASQVSGSVTEKARNPKQNLIHEVEILVTVIVKDINDNAPIFPNVTMFGEVQENGPIDNSPQSTKPPDNSPDYTNPPDDPTECMDHPDDSPECSTPPNDSPEDFAQPEGSAYPDSPPCGQNPQGRLYELQEDIALQRPRAAAGQLTQAESMVKRSHVEHVPGNPGDNVTIPIPRSLFYKLRPRSDLPTSVSSASHFSENGSGRGRPARTFKRDKSAEAYDLNQFSLKCKESKPHARYLYSPSLDTQQSGKAKVTSLAASSFNLSNAPTIRSSHLSLVQFFFPVH